MLDWLMTDYAPMLQRQADGKPDCSQCVTYWCGAKASLLTCLVCTHCTSGVPTPTLQSWSSRCPVSVATASECSQPGCHDTHVGSDGRNCVSESTVTTTTASSGLLLADCMQKWEKQLMKENMSQVRTEIVAKLHVLWMVTGSSLFSETKSK